MSEIEHTDAPLVVMKKPAPSFSDHGWRAIAMCGDWMVAARYEEACVIEGGIVKKTWNNEANARRIVACMTACKGIPDAILQSWLNPPEGQLGARHGTWAAQLAEAGRQQIELQKRIDRLVSIAKTFRFRIGGALYTMRADDRELALSVERAIAEAEAA